MEQVPEIASKFEPDNPGTHVTDTVDYAIVLGGEVWLELDDGAQHHLEAHDVVIQNGTRHAWRNKTKNPRSSTRRLVSAAPALASAAVTSQVWPAVWAEDSHVRQSPAAA